MDSKGGTHIFGISKQNDTYIMDFASIIATELSLPITGVVNTIKLLSEGASVPFIARYRKEATGSLDEVVIIAIRDRLHQLEELEKRRVS